MLLSRVDAPKGMLAVANLAVRPTGIALLIQIDEHIRLTSEAVSTIRVEFWSLTHLFGIRGWRVDSLAEMGQSGICHCPRSR